MNDSRSGKKVTIILGHTAGEHGKQGYLRVLERLKSEGAERAAAFKAIAALDGRSGVQSLRLAEVAPDLPVMIVWIDAADRVERILPRILDLVPDGTILVEDVEVFAARSTVVPELPRGLTVGDVMTREVVTVLAATPVSELVDDLLRKSIRAVPVVDEAGLVIGIVTNGDLLRRGGLPAPLSLLQSVERSALHDEVQRVTPRSRVVGEVMTAPVVTVHADMGIREAARLMQSRKLKRLPVVDTEGRLVGIVSRLDLLRTVAMPGSADGESHPPATVDGAAPIGSIMSTAAPVVGSEAPIAEVIDVVASTRLHRAVVIDEDRRVIGLVRGTELLERLLPHEHRHVLPMLARLVPFLSGSRGEEETPRIAEGRCARDVMITDVLTVNIGDPVREVLAEMLSRQAKIVPVVDADERLVGVVDRADLLGVMTSG